MTYIILVYYIHLYAIACLYRFISEKLNAWSVSFEASGMTPRSLATVTGTASTCPWLRLGSGRLASNCDRLRNSWSLSLHSPSRNASINACGSGNSKSARSSGSGRTSSGMSCGTGSGRLWCWPRNPENEQAYTNQMILLKAYIRYIPGIYHA